MSGVMKLNYNSVRGRPAVLSCGLRACRRVACECVRCEVLALSGHATEDRTPDARMYASNEPCCSQRRIPDGLAEDAEGQRRMDLLVPGDHGRPVSALVGPPRAP